MILKHFALFGLVLSGVMTIAGHASSVPELSPWHHTISDFAAYDRGGLVEFAMGLAAMSSLALLPSIKKFGRAAVALMGTWSGSLMVATIIPTDPVGEALGTAGYVHRYASALAFLALLAGGLLIAKRMPSTTKRNMRWLSAVGIMSGAAMMASTYVFDRIAIGATERVMAAAELAVIVIVALEGLPRELRLAPTPEMI